MNYPCYDCKSDRITKWRSRGSLGPPWAKPHVLSPLVAILQDADNFTSVSSFNGCWTFYGWISRRGRIPLLHRHLTYRHLSSRPIHMDCANYLIIILFICLLDDYSYEFSHLNKWPLVVRSERLADLAGMH